MTPPVVAAVTRVDHETGTATLDLAGVAPGTYAVTVTDAGGCIATLTDGLAVTASTR